MLARRPRAGSRSLWLWWLIGLTLLGLILRLLASWETNARLPDAPIRLIGDEVGYDWMARELLQGNFFPWPGRTPVYPIFLFVIFAIFGYSFATVLYVQAFVGAAAIPLTYALARRFVDSFASLVAAGLIAVHPVLIRHGQNLYTEVLYTPLLLLAILALLWALQAPQMLRFLAAGAVLALVNLTRPTAVLLPLILLVLLPWVWGIRRCILLLAVYVLGMILVIAPWTYHNYRTHDAFLPLAVNSIVLWQGSPEYYHLMQEGHSFFEMWEQFANPANNGGHDPFTIEGSAFFNARALASIREEPLVYIWYSAQKVLYFWLGHPMADWEWPFDLENMRLFYPPWWQFWGIYVSRLVPWVAFAGLVVLRRRLRDFLPLLAVIGYFTLFHALAYPEVRYSEPLHPLLAIIIAGALREVLPLPREESESEASGHGAPLAVGVRPE